MTRLPHVLALTGAGLILASCKPPGAAPAPTMAAAATVTVAIPVQKRIMEWDEFVGRLSSPKTVQLRARVSGYLEKIHFKEGGEVKENDIHANYQNGTLRIQVPKIEAQPQVESKHQIAIEG